MSIICHLCGEVKENGRMCIHGRIGSFVMVCDECFMESKDHLEEMRGCGCGGNCK